MQTTPCENFIVPVFEADPCNGTVVSASCVKDSSLYSELGLESNATQQQINQAQYLASLNTKSVTDNLQTQIDVLGSSIPDGSETKLTEGTNIIITGTGTTPNPYIINVVKPYKTYTALISQSGTSAPIAEVLENTLSGGISWIYGGVGFYYGTLSGAFTDLKTHAIISGGLGIGADIVKIGRISNNTVMITVADNSGGALDGVISSASIEIKVYN